jgi:hypothetical protein
MGYVRDSLLPNEMLFAEAKPHWTALVPALVILLFGAFAVIWFGLWASPLLAVGLVWLARLWLDRFTTEILVTSRRVIARSGFWKCETIELEHKNIESFVVQQTPIGRMFNYGTVIVNGLGGARVPLVGLARPGQFRRAALQAEEHYRLAGAAVPSLLDGALTPLGQEVVLQLKLDPQQLARARVLPKPTKGTLLEHDPQGDNEGG